jgi:hypothetical protein
MGNFEMSRLLFVNVKLFVEPVHQYGIDKYDHDKSVNGPLLSKPETQLKTTYPDAVELIGKYDSASV